MDTAYMLSSSAAGPSTKRRESWISMSSADAMPASGEAGSPPKPDARSAKSTSKLPRSGPRVPAKLAPSAAATSSWSVPSAPYSRMAPSGMEMSKPRAEPSETVRSISVAMEAFSQVVQVLPCWKPASITKSGR